MNFARFEGPPHPTGVPDSKWIEFAYIGKSKSGKTDIWAVMTNDIPRLRLGLVSWYGEWRQYAFHPAENTVFEKQCLRDIAQFCEFLNRKRKEEHATIPKQS